MADEYKVKKVQEGPYAGKWGVYKDNQLMMAFTDKKSATRDANRRNG